VEEQHFADFENLVEDLAKLSANLCWLESNVEQSASEMDMHKK